jgi:hypothetical protein
MKLLLKVMILLGGVKLLLVKDLVLNLGQQVIVVSSSSISLDQQPDTLFSARSHEKRSGANFAVRSHNIPVLSTTNSQNERVC